MPEVLEASTQSFEQRRAESLQDPLSDVRSINLHSRTLLESKPYKGATAEPIKFSDRLEPYTYAENNSVLLFVDGEGTPKLAIATPKRLEALRGFKETDMYVPYSVTVPGESSSQAIWDKVRLMDVAESHGVDLPNANPEQHPEGEWVELRDGQAVIDGAGDTLRINERSYSDKARTVGHYSTNHNIIAFVDPSGRHWEGPASRENLNWIQRTGYQYGEVGVWLSNHNLAPDAPDANVKQHWQKIIHQERETAA